MRPGRTHGRPAAVRRRRARAPRAGRCPRATASSRGPNGGRSRLPASSIMPSTRPRAASGTYIAERMSSCLHDLDVLGAAKPLVQHLLGQVCDDLGQAVDDHPLHERRLRDPADRRGASRRARPGRGGCARPRPARTGRRPEDVDDDEVGQPRRRHPGDALEARHAARRTPPGSRSSGRAAPVAARGRPPPPAPRRAQRPPLPTACPSGSTRGPMAACTRIGEPSPRRMSNTPCHARPAAARSPIWRARPTCASGMIRSTIERPLAASAAMPNSCSAAEFQTATRRSVSVTTTAAGAWPITSAATISSMTRMAPRVRYLLGGPR